MYKTLIAAAAALTLSLGAADAGTHGKTNATGYTVVKPIAGKTMNAGRTGAFVRGYVRSFSR